jgi:hypothetical protein
MLMHITTCTKGGHVKHNPSKAAILTKKTFATIEGLTCLF